MNGYVAGGILLVVAAGSAFGGYHYESIKFDAYKSDQGKVASQAATHETAAVLKATQTAASNLHDVDQNYQDQLKQQKATYEKLMHSGMLSSAGRLRVPTVSCSASSTGLSTPGISGPDNAGSAELSSQFSAGLLADLARADRYAIQVNALLAVAAADRKAVAGMCGATEP